MCVCLTYKGKTIFCFKCKVADIFICCTTSTPFGQLLLGGAAERNFDHPARPPLS